MYCICGWTQVSIAHLQPTEKSTSAIRQPSKYEASYEIPLKKNQRTWRRKNIKIKLAQKSYNFAQNELTQ